ncbi:hypothetical protein ACLMAJ_06850 [Nocardia sp. KC 131]|uniref:hypothetical protein n=1 Tax=Nocardia arseniciresistens TaxID=3392119 RepID=UPI00398F348B
MEERIGGKIFDPHGYDDDPIDPELLAKANAAFAELNSREPEYNPADLPERFRDDLVGTEFEHVYREAEERRRRDREAPSSPNGGVKE